MRDRPAPNPLPIRAPVYAIALISASALAYEVLLMRLFSIVQWHHFAYMVISLALLGYGASGALLTLARGRLLPHFGPAFVLGAVLFGITSLGGFLLAQQLPFNTLEILWDRRQWLYLLACYLLLFLPFLCAASCICLAFQRFGGEIGRLYSFDLLGAGAGSLGIILLLFLLAPAELLRLLALAGPLAGILAVWQMGLPGRRLWLTGLLALSGLLAALPAAWLEPRLSEYKELSQLLRIPGTRVLAERSSPLGLVTLIESPQVPLRQAPGLSLGSPASPPEQLGILSDGDALTPINRYDGRREGLAYLDWLTSALPYHLSPPGRVLVLGAGGGSGVLQAVYHGVEQIDAVELNPQVAQLVTDDYAEFSGWNLLQDRINLHIAEARGFVAASPERYDLIQVALLDAAGAASAGVYALSESYLYTLEALQEYLAHLAPNGWLAITRWVQLPPRDGVKLLASAAQALRNQGVRDPGARLLMIRGWSTSTLLVRNGPVTPAEVERLRAFSAERSFDLIWYPGMAPDQANRYHRLDAPYFHQAARALLAGPEQARAFIEQYKFMLEPATDDRPYYFNFFRWRSLPEILGLWGQGGLPLLELGYPVLAATLVQALLASLVLILLPLALLRRREPATGGAYSGRVAIYFTAIGLAFLMLEIAFIQRFILFLSHPLYAVAVVLCGFLLFSGLGSRFAGRLANRRRGMLAALAALAAVALAYLWLLPPLFQALIALPDPLKIALALALIAPLAFPMGMPFPLALSNVSARAPGLVPWAWGVNGCASLISAVLATLLAIHFGFSLVVLGALGLYGLAALSRP